MMQTVLRFCLAFATLSSILLSTTSASATIRKSKDIAEFRRDVIYQAEKEAQNSLRKNRLHDDLLSKAVPLKEYEARLKADHGIELDSRRMEEGDDGEEFYEMDDDAMYSFSGYSLKYAKCQPVQKFSEEALENGDYSPMVTEDIVVLRLCPYKSCSENRQYGCYYNYVEYALGVTDYIRIMLKYVEDRLDALCQWCDECNQGGQRKLEDEAEDDGGEDNEEGEDNGGEDNNNGEGEGNNDAENDDYQPYYDYNGYYWYDANDDCYKYGSYCDEDLYQICYAENGDENNDDGNGYLAANEYINYANCAEIEDVYGEIYWVRPHCDTDDGTIKMGAYYNEECTKYAGNDVDISNQFEIRFNENIFEAFYDGTCVDCSESNYPPNFGYNSYMCNMVHYHGAQCQASLEYDLFDGYGDQSDDSTDCAFIESIRFGTYDEEGEISISYSKDAEPQVTLLQKIGLISSAAFCALLIFYSCYLHHSMTNLLIKSLSHRELLPPSRHSKRRSPGPRSRTNKKGKGAKTATKLSSKNRDEEDEEDEWATPHPPEPI